MGAKRLGFEFWMELTSYKMWMILQLNHLNKDTIWANPRKA
jgi:hypothetical protein